MGIAFVLYCKYDMRQTRVNSRKNDLSLLHYLVVEVELLKDADLLHERAALQHSSSGVAVGFGIALAVAAVDVAVRATTCS